MFTAMLTCTISPNFDDKERVQKIKQKDTDPRYYSTSYIILMPLSSPPNFTYSCWQDAKTPMPKFTSMMKCDVR